MSRVTYSGEKANNTRRGLRGGNDG